LERIQGLEAFEAYFPAAFYLSGNLNYLAGNLERARQSAEKYVSQQPNSVPGKILLAAILLRQSEPQKAIDQLQPIVTASSEDFTATALLATAYMMDKQPTKAAELYDRALKLHPDSVEVRLRLAQTFLGAGDTKRAVSELERIVAASPDAPGASALLVVSL